MTDYALRRRARLADLDPEAEADRFRRQLRSGLIEPKRIELLAYLGDPVACEALGQEPPQGEGVADWIRGLSRWGRIPCARAVLALLDARVLPARHAPHADWVDGLRNWVACPCAAHASASGSRLLKVRGRRRIGQLTWRVVAPIFSRPTYRWAAPQKVLQERVCSALLPWALTELGS